MENYKIKTVNNTYEIINHLRPDRLYNIYVQRTSNLTDAYKGESTYSIGIKEPIVLDEKDVINLTYYI